MALNKQVLRWCRKDGTETTSNFETKIQANYAICSALEQSPNPHFTHIIWENWQDFSCEIIDLKNITKSKITLAHSRMFQKHDREQAHLKFNKSINQ